jgi:glutamate N-acetyltransferase/amino-acid N-acetyltransferase
VLPYQALHHAQQREMSDFLGVEVKFVPIVTDQFDRGIVSCIQVTNIANRWDLEKVKALYRFAYDSQPSVQLRLEGIGVTTDVEGTPIVLLSNLSLSGDGHTLFIQSNIDNLMAGGGFSSYANVRRLLGLSAFPPHTRDPRMCFTDALASPSALHVSYTSSSQESYNRFMNALTLPAGFHVATTNVPFFPREMGGSRKKVLQFSCLRMDSPCEWDAVYTQNPNCGHPVKIGRQRLLSGSKLRALWINNKIANVGIEGGLADAEAISSAFAQEFCCSSSEVIPLSTGIIGWQLPRDEMILNVPCITHGATTVMEMARAMMTTDTYPKGICHYFRNGGMLCGVAKGGGMIEPRLGTMLAVLMTDVSFSRGEVDPILRSVVDETFNCCSVDADTSTSDAVVIISSGKLPPVSCEEMHEALLYVCTHLTRHVVWNGEGVMHVMQVNVLGAPDRDTAVKIGKNVVNSPLVKAAMAGNDPNVGRIYGAMGRGIENVDWTRANVRLGAEFIVLNGNSVLWNEQLEKTISDYLKSCQIYDKASPKPPYPVHDNAIVIEVSLYDGSASATVWGGDLTADYVSINSDYRS